ncbi:MAG: rhomboid family intramembrane serine protease [Crocinitomicaceae bacterium]
MSLIFLILILTIAISWQANQNFEMKEKMLFIPYLVKQDRQYYRFVSHILIHSDIMHLAFNMISLFSLGEIFERQLRTEYGDFQGILHFCIIYFIGGIFAGLIIYFKNQDNPSYRSLGASGAVSAIIFASIIWNPTMSLMLMFIPIPIPAFLFGPIYLLIEYFAMRRGGTGIAHDAHIGGAIFGIIYCLLLNLDKGKQFIDLIF